MDEAFKNALADVITVQGVKQPATLEPIVVQTLYDGTPDSSKGRTLMVDLIQYYGRGYLENHASQLPYELLVKLALALCTSKADGVRKNLRQDKCYYHEHIDGKSCDVAGGA